MKLYDFAFSPNCCKVRALAYELPAFRGAVWIGGSAALLSNARLISRQ